MIESRTIRLEDHDVEVRTIWLENIEGDASIEFLRVEKIMGDYRYSPFVLVRYSLNKEEQKYGLRLDLDKKVFLDHLDDQEKEDILQAAAPKIVKFLEESALYDER